MPVPAGTRFRVKTMPGGKKVRLAFNRSGKVIEAKSMRGALADHIRGGKFKNRKR